MFDRQTRATISVETVKKSFKKCSISNAMHRAKDDMLW